MAAYNADIRIGITGKAGLNQLEKQLGRVNKDVKALNKALTLKTRAQTIKLNTKGANAAIKQLEDRINRLGRTVRVNLRTTESKSESRSRGNTTIVGGSSGSSSAQAAIGVALQTQLQVTKELNQADQKRFETNQALNDQFNKITAQKDKELKLQEQIRRVEAGAKTNKQGQDFNRVAGGLGLGNKTAPALKELNKQLNGTRTSIRNLEARVPRLTTEFNQASKAVRDNSKALDANNKKLKDNAINQGKAAAKAKLAAKQRGQFTKGALGAGGVAASSALAGIPGLGGAATGATLGFLTAGAPGAIGGAIAGGIVEATTAMAAFGATSAKTAAEVRGLEIALGLVAGDDLTRSLEIIRQSVDDFNTPLVEATDQFTKLYAASSAAGIPLKDLENLFIGLSAGNKAFKGDAEDLNGILRAFQQIISKGTVQSEELKGQVGERLPGAFAMAAKSLGLTTRQLQKALENGEVESRDFVKKFGQYMLRFDDDAKTIADSPTEAGARLNVALQDLEVAVGKNLEGMGADFQNFATEAIKGLTRLATFMGKIGAELEGRINALGGNPTAGIEGALAGIGKAEKNIKNNMDTLIDPQSTQDQIKQAVFGLKFWEKSLDNFQKKLDSYKLDDEIVVPKPPATAEGDDDDTNKPKTGSGPRDTVAEAMRERQELERILGLRQQITGEETELQAIQRERTERLAELEREIGDIKADNITEASKAAEITNAELKAALDLLDLDQQRNEVLRTKAEEQAKAAAAFQSEVADLELALGIEKAVTEQEREQLELARAKAGIEARKDLTDGQKNTLKGLEEQLSQARMDNTGISGYLKELQAELTNTDAMIVSLAQTVETELSRAMSTALIGLIDGTKTAEEAFADMFKNIGASFIQMATDMIAKALVMKALGILTGAFGGGGGGSGLDLDGVASYMPGGSSFEGGGYTGNAPRSGGIDGRGGFPAILHPNETVIDHSSVMGKYSGAGSSSNGGNKTIRFESTVINSVEYVTTSQAIAMSRQAANDGARRGTEGGYGKSMSALQNSRSQRNKLGMRR